MSSDSIDDLLLWGQVHEVIVQSWSVFLTAIRIMWIAAGIGPGGGSIGEGWSVSEERRLYEKLLMFG